MNIWQVYKERGFFAQCTDAEGLAAAGEEGPLTGYIGFDPTADSFHVGHLIPIMALVHFQRAGHRPIALMGAGTAMIGDPTGKNEMRQMLSVEQLDANVKGLERQLGRLLDFRAGAILANNADWLRGLKYIEFLRDIGPHFSVNRMLTFETFKMRMAQEGAGLSFIEFNYPLLQAYDFLELQRRHGCALQMGGDDQWANIISGVELVRRLARTTVYGWTFPLHTTASGAKMGKTEQGAVWLDADKTPPYDYYQYWINVDDRDVAKCLRLFTLLAPAEIADLERLQGADIRRAKQRLAYETTALVHGEEEARRAERGARALFGGTDGDLDQAPSTVYSLSEAVPVVNVLAEVGMAKSRSEARRLIAQGGVSVNDRRVASEDEALSSADAVDGAILLRVGKKKFHRLVVQ